MQATSSNNQLFNKLRTFKLPFWPRRLACAMRACVRHTWWRTKRSWPLFSPTFFLLFFLLFFSTSSAFHVLFPCVKICFQLGQVWSEITQIYLNLEESKTFIKAISSDGRSYSSSLFSMTETVLIKVGRADLASALGQIAAKAEIANTAFAKEEELLADCPDEFLCPIMSIIMMDPVKLPSSKQTVDR